MSDDQVLFWGLPVAEAPDGPGRGEVSMGMVTFHNFEPIVQMMTALELAAGDDHPEEEWDALCAAYQVDPNEQREFRAAVRARLDEDA